MSLGARLRRWVARWRRVVAVLVALDLLFLAVEAREYRHRQILSRLVKVRTVEAYAHAVARAGPERSRVLFDLGNLHLEEGTRGREPAALRAALGYYREALRLEPGLLEGKRNYEVARRVLDGLIPPRDPREPRPPDRMSPSRLPLLPTDI